MMLFCLWEGFRDSYMDISINILENTTQQQLTSAKDNGNMIKIIHKSTWTLFEIMLALLSQTSFFIPVQTQLQHCWTEF